MPSNDAIGQAMAEVVQARIAEMDERDRYAALPSLVLYLWALSVGEPHSAESMAKYLPRPTLELLQRTAADLRAMHDPQG